jgi:hypothetical protein
MASHRDDCLGVLREWNRCHGAFYRAEESDLRWNLEEQPYMRFEAVTLAGTNAIVCETAPAGVAEGILEKGIWVSLFGKVPRGLEDDFAGAAEALARARGRERIAIGSDEFHFVPGIPIDEPDGVFLADSFVARGFSSKECADYVGSPSGAAASAYARDACEEAARRGWTLRPAETASDREALGAFLLREFPGRWHREWRFQLARSDAGRAFWSLLRDESGTVLGFSRLAKRGRIAGGWTPGAMRLALSAEEARSGTDSCLGPIGISKSERGKGAGKILLGLSLQELRSQGAALTCIDWTDAFAYYAPLGFAVARRWRCVWKDL